MPGAGCTVAGACLMQGQASLILDDLHSTSIVEALTSGRRVIWPCRRAPPRKRAMAITVPMLHRSWILRASSTPSVPRSINTFRTDRATWESRCPDAEHAAFVPGSEIRAGGSSARRRSCATAALHAVNPKEVLCARKADLVVSVEGAPLVFSTDYAHEVALTVSTKDHKSLDLPVRADPVQGGFVVNTSSLNAAHLDDNIQGSLHGYWGFEKYDGRAFAL